MREERQREEKGKAERLLSFDEIQGIVKPLAEKYQIDEVYLFGSYARKEATEESDLDFLVYGGPKFKSIFIFAFAEDLRMLTKKDVDAFEISEVNVGSPFYQNVMRDKVKVA